jgi:hypothetical protein
MLLTYFLNDFEMVPVAPIIAGITFVFTLLLLLLLLLLSINVKKVKCTLVQALRLCTGRTVHSGSRGIALLYRHSGSVQAVRPIGGGGGRGIALLFHDHGTRKG